MKYFLFCLFLFSLVVLNASYLVSFSGDSFLFQSLDSSHLDTTSVFLRFQTSIPDGLLLLALGHSQFLLIELKNGRIEVKINLGHGEEVLSTSENDLLNNLIWHDFKVIRSGKKVKLVLNGNDVASGEIYVPSKKNAKLAIDFGVFLGGMGGNITLPKGVQPAKFYRGCLLEAEVNGHDLLTPLTSVRNEKVSYNVLPGCPKVYRALRSEAITFDSPSSFVALKRWTTQDEGTVECTLKTTATSGIILFNAGRGRGEFIGLEMVDGVIGASVNKGGGVVALHTTTAINDGNWHSVRFSFSPSYLDIRVDDNLTKAFVEQTESEVDGRLGDVRHHNLDLSGHLYIGGVPAHVLNRDSVPHSLLSLSNSQGGAFPGCMKNIRVNHRRKGLSDFVISNKVSSGCRANPQFAEAKVRSDGQDTFEGANAKISTLFTLYEKSHRAENKVVPTTSTSTTQSTTAARSFRLPVMDVMTRPLTVQEGQLQDLSETILNVNITGGSIAVLNSEILFMIYKQPSHGTLVKFGKCETELELSSFTLGEVASNGISYCHDGSETSSDRFQFKILWNLRNKDVKVRKRISEFVDPSQVVGANIDVNNGTTYTQSLIISPVDDPPELFIPGNYVFHPVMKTKTELPSAILHATDADSPANQITYSVMSGRSPSFFIENSNSLGQPILSFTQDDLDKHLLSFVHKGGVDHTRLILRVFNPSSEIGARSSTGVLRISAVPLRINAVVKNITLPERTSLLLTEEYLSTLSNADEGSVDLLFVLKEKPTVGQVEVMLYDEETWVTSNNFTQSQIANGHVRYRHTTAMKNSTKMVSDRFTFTASGAGVETSPYSISAKILKVELKLNLDPINLTNGIQGHRLSPEQISIVINHVNPTPDEIKLILEAVPKFLIFFNSEEDRIIEKVSSFTMGDVASGIIGVKVKPEFAAQSFDESVPVVAIARDVYTSNRAKFLIVYKADLTEIQLEISPLVLDEGSKTMISTENLKAFLPESNVTRDFQEFSYLLTRMPENGVLMLRGDGVSWPTNISQFFSSDLEGDKVYYRHDDSETTHDSFEIHIRPVIEHELPHLLVNLSKSEIMANFSISVNLVNDEEPYRVVDKVFEIALGRSRLLSKDDLWYEDGDADFDDLDLVYLLDDLENVAVVANGNEQDNLKRFTQQDITDKKVFVVHQGTENGRIRYEVDDGVHAVKGGNKIIKYY